MKFISIQLTLIITLILGFSSKSFAKRTDLKQTLKEMTSINESDPYCSKNLAKSEDPPLFTERLIQMGSKFGVSSETDWKWLNLIQKLHLPFPHTEESYLESIKKGQAINFDEYIRMGNCHINLKATLTTGISKDNKEVVVLDQVSNLRIISSDPNCNCDLDKLNCAQLSLNKKMVCRRVITQNSASPLISKSTITTDFLNDIRSEKRQSEIIEKCRN